MSEVLTILAVALFFGGCGFVLGATVNHMRELRKRQTFIYEALDKKYKVQ
jgi:hypothetical protein